MVERQFSAGMRKSIKTEQEEIDVLKPKKEKHCLSKSRNEFSHLKKRFRSCWHGKESEDAMTWRPPIGFRGVTERYAWQGVTERYALQTLIGWKKTWRPSYEASRRWDLVTKQRENLGRKVKTFRKQGYLPRKFRSGTCVHFSSCMCAICPAQPQSSISINTRPLPFIFLIQNRESLP